jgi:hypothetical protein
MYAMSEGAWPSLVVTVFGSLKVCKKEGGLRWSMAMAKQLWDDGLQGLCCGHSTHWLGDDSAAGCVHRSAPPVEKRKLL